MSPCDATAKDVNTFFASKENVVNFFYLESYTDSKSKENFIKTFTNEKNFMIIEPKALLL